MKKITATVEVAVHSANVPKSTPLKGESSIANKHVYKSRNKNKNL